MATYPSDAVFDISNNFTSLGSVTYTNTGGIETDFVLAVPVLSEAEVFAIADGITQSTASYTLSNNGGTINFFSAPNASNLTLKSISVPERFKKLKTIDTILSSYFSNSSVTIIDSNNYLVDGETSEFAVHSNAVPSSTNEIFVFIDGVSQDSTHYTFPSSTLDNKGIEFVEPLPSTSTLEIRTIISNSTLTIRCNSMEDRKPDRGFNESKNFDVSIFESQAGYEKRRLISRRAKRQWRLTYTNISGVEKEAIQQFYNERNGEFDDFTFNLDHINQTGSATVRFDGELQMQHNAAMSTREIDNFYTISLTLREVFG